MYPLVSIVTPCYNGEAFLDQYFKSILDQTYRNIELIFVNDGSEDGTERIALSYAEVLEKRGIKFKYLFQPNGGQAKALNTGLREVTGEYLVWPDSDDLMPPESIEKRADFLVKNPEFAWVRSDVRVIDHDTGASLFTLVPEFQKCNKDIFLDLILENTFCCCSYMVRVDALRAIYPDLQIYESRQGQNWQILVPMAAAHICGYIDEPLYLYIIRNNSHSHQKRTLEESLQRYDGLEDILRRSVAISGRTDRDYDRIIYIKRLKHYLRIYLEYGDSENATRYYKMLRQEGELEGSDTGIYLRKLHPVQYGLYKISCLCNRIFRKVGKIFSR